MRLLIDANLPLSLADWFKARGHDCRHVLELGLAQSKDEVVWAEATRSQEIVVSKDQDFADKVRARNHGPAVLWIRTGNGSTQDLLSVMASVCEAVERRLEAGDRLVEVRGRAR